jgi:hypothetical protein
MMEDGHGLAKREVEVCSGEKSSPVAGHPAINLIGLQVPASSDQQKSQIYHAFTCSRPRDFLNCPLQELSFLNGYDYNV